MQGNLSKTPDTGTNSKHLHLGVFTGDFNKYVGDCGGGIVGCFPGYSHKTQKQPFEVSGDLISIGVPYEYKGYFFDGLRTKKNAFYDPFAVIYSNGGVITRHK